MAAKYGMVICWRFRNRDLRALRIPSEDAVIKRSFVIAYGIRQGSAARSRLSGNGAERNGHCHTVGAASVIWRP